MPKKNNTYSLAELKDEFIGPMGTPNREKYEYKLSMDLLGKMIQSARKERKLTQTELGNLIGVQKAQISKIENSASSASIDTLLRLFQALKAEIQFTVKIEDHYLSL